MQLPLHMDVHVPSATVCHCLRRIDGVQLSTQHCSPFSVVERRVASSAVFLLEWPISPPRAVAHKL